ncbi:MAG: gamma-glutamylcyclotransferase, partial [Planctomycetota bacterium]
LYRLFDLGSYPGLVEWPDGREIHGELYAVTPQNLLLLDDAKASLRGSTSDARSCCNPPNASCSQPHHRPRNPRPPLMPGSG